MIGSLAHHLNSGDTMKRRDSRRVAEQFVSIKEELLNLTSFSSRNISYIYIQSKISRPFKEID